MMEHVRLTQQEQARLQVLNNLLAGYMTTEQAAILMGLSARHTRRILAAYREKGAAAIAHGNRGRSPANAEHTGDRSSTSGSDQIRRSQPHAPERVAEGARGYRHRSRHVTQDTD